MCGGCDRCWLCRYQHTAGGLLGNLKTDGWAITKGHIKATISAAVHFPHLFERGELDAILDSLN